MEIALILRDIGKKAFDGSEEIKASVVVQSIMKEVLQSKPDRDDLLALSKSQYRKAYPGRLFPHATFTNSYILKQWIYNLTSNTIVTADVSADLAASMRGSYMISMRSDLYAKLQQLANENGIKRHDLIESILTEWTNNSQHNTAGSKRFVTDAQYYSYSIGQIARLERDLTGNFNPDKYLIEIPKDKINAVKTYAKTELTEKEFNEKFDRLKGLSLDHAIEPSNYGYFMGGFYGIGIGNIN